MTFMLSFSYAERENMHACMKAKTRLWLRMQDGYNPRESSCYLFTNPLPR